MHKKLALTPPMGWSSWNLFRHKINEDLIKEIADATNVSINTALGRMRYAILNMRRIAEENNIVLTAI